MLTTFNLMDAGMTYEEAIIFQVKFFIIAFIIIAVMYFVEKITKKYCPKIYQKLKQYNVF